MRFDYCHNVKKWPVPLTRGLFEKVIHAPWLSELAARIAAGCLDEKSKLPAGCWQSAYNGQKRANTTATSSGLFALDVDHVDDPQALYESFKERIPELGIYIVHKTPSTHGLRVVAKCHRGLTTIAQNQSWLAREINVQHDAATHDFARLSYLVPADYFYYYDPAIFTDEPDVVLDTNQQFGGHPVSEVVASSNSNSAPLSDPVDLTIPKNPDLKFQGVLYSDIVEDLLRRMGGAPFEGMRNNTLFDLCRYLASITDRKPDLIFRICPHFGLGDDEVYNTCKSVCRYPTRCRLPVPLYKTLRSFGIDCNPKAIAEAFQSKPETDDEILATFSNPVDGEPVTLRFPDTDHLPPLIREFVATAPDDFREATALVCLPVCGFLGSRLRSTYSDEALQAPSFIVNVIAPAASGKSELLRVPDICLRRAAILRPPNQTPRESLSPWHQCSAYYPQ